MKIARLATALVAMLIVLAGCSVEEIVGPPNCSGSRSGLIAAQSVPTATLLPCFGDLPPGWEVESVDITQAGTKVVLDSDRAGLGAARLEFVAECDIGDAISEPSEKYPMTERFDSVELAPRFRGDRYYLFDGGCVWWHFDFDAGVLSAMSIELGNSLMLIDRQAYNDSFRDTFIDEDL